MHFTEIRAGAQVIRLQTAIGRDRGEKPHTLPLVRSEDADQRRWRVRAPQDGDFERWRALYQSYADFYGSRQSDTDAATVWAWIHDPQHEVAALVVEDEQGQVVGLAHYRPFARPLAASVGCFLDDLFIDPNARGGGAADALLGELRRLAKAHNWSVIRWITADDNYRGRAVYDRHATRTTWVTYDMTF